jgi:hypothetical protein
MSDEDDEDEDDEGDEDEEGDEDDEGDEDEEGDEDDEGDEDYKGDDGDGDEPIDEADRVAALQLKAKVDACVATWHEWEPTDPAEVFLKRHIDAADAKCGDAS